MKTARNPEGVHAPIGRYVHQIEVSGESRLLFVSGQVGMKADGTVPEDPVEQFEVALDNVLANLAVAGFEPSDLVKVTTYVVGELDGSRRRAILDDRLGAHVSTSTLVFIAALATPQFKVEIEAWASRQ